MSWLALNGASTNTVIGCGILPQLVQMTKTLLNDTPKKLGVPAAGMIFNFGLCAFSVYALLTGQSYADNGRLSDMLTTRPLLPATSPKDARAARIPLAIFRSSIVASCKRAWLAPTSLSCWCTTSWRSASS